MIELTFPVKGTFFPADHNYGLYSSLIHFNEELRHSNWQLGTINGIPQHNGLIQLGDQSRLTIRCEPKEIEKFIDLKSVTVGKWTINVGTPRATELAPTKTLISRLVTIKGGEDRKSLAKALLRQSRDLGINASYAIGDRKTIKIKRYSIIGFEVIADCSEEDSLTLKKIGLGGKRKMGCGVFYGID